MTSDELKTIIEMIRLIIADSKDKEDALKKIDSLTRIIHDALKIAIQIKIIIAYYIQLLMS